MKPYILPFLIAVVMLFGQGFADLFLPNLMSDIVNTGIQNGGIEHSSPDAISKDGMKLLKLFMDPTDKKTVDKNYHLTNKNSEDYDLQKEKYPVLESDDQGIYIINDTVNRDMLDEIFAHASMGLFYLVSDISENPVINEGQTKKTDPPEDITLLYNYSSSPGFQRAAEKYTEKAKDSDLLTAESVAKSLMRLFYRELKADTDKIQMNYIFRVGINMIIVTLLGVIASVICSYIAARISSGIAKNLRRDVFAAVESFGNEEFDKFSSASLITRTTNDVTQIQNIVNMGIRMICYAPIMGIGGIILAASTTVSLSGVIIGATIALFLVMGIIMLIALPKFRIIQKLIDRLNLVTRESLSGILVIRAFGTEKHEEDRFDKANTDLTKTNLFVNRVMTFLMPIMTLILNLVSILIVWFGAGLIDSGNIQIGDMMAFIQYALMIILSFLIIGAMFIIIPRASVSAKRIYEVLKCTPSVRDPETPIELSECVCGEIEFKNVSFRYSNADADVLSDISFVAKPGQTTAFIGSTGSGKSTLISLIPRFYDTTGGTVTFDGTDIKNLRLHDLREQIGMVPQKGILFSGDIDSNLRYGRTDADKDEVIAASKTAQADSFIKALPDGYSSPIAQGGTNVSGGQRQRLAIARALVKKASVYIFDDSFSALDMKTDAALRKALKKYTYDSTVIIVAQRVSTIMHADQIIVLEQGRIVGKGTHNELLKTCGTYREIAVSQDSANEI